MKFLIATVAMTLLAGGPASALKIGTCTVTVLNDGVLKADPTLKTLSSRNSGGTSVMVRVKSDFSGSLLGAVCAIGLPLNCGRVRLTAPTGFAVPPGEPSPDSIGKLTPDSGSQMVLVQENATSMVILNGEYTFRVDLDASKASGIFRAGTYRTTQTVVCD